MINVKTYKKAYELILKKFNLKDIAVEFSAGNYEIRPCLVAISQDGCKQNICIDDSFYNVSYAYVDELNCYRKYDKVSPWIIIKSMFNLAKHSSIYMISDKSMADIDCCRHKKEDFIMLRKGLQIDCFIVEAGLAIDF